MLFWQSKIITVTAFAQDLPKLVKTSLQGTATTPHTARCVARALIEAAETAAVPQPHNQDPGHAHQRIQTVISGPMGFTLFWVIGSPHRRFGIRFGSCQAKDFFLSGVWGRTLCVLLNGTPSTFCVAPHSSLLLGCSYTESSPSR